MADDTGDEVPEGHVRIFHPGMTNAPGKGFAVVTEEQFDKVWSEVGWQKRSSKARAADDDSKKES